MVLMLTIVSNFCDISDKEKQENCQTVLEGGARRSNQPGQTEIRLHMGRTYRRHRRHPETGAFVRV